MGIPADGAVKMSVPTQMGGQAQSDVGRAENPERPSVYGHAASLMAEAQRNTKACKLLSRWRENRGESEKMRRENG